MSKSFRRYDRTIAPLSGLLLLAGLVVTFAYPSFEAARLGGAIVGLSLGLMLGYRLASTDFSQAKPSTVNYTLPYAG